MNRNQLKLLVCACMLCDHIGYLLLPEVAVLRHIGRVAFPLFAFFVGEGSRYTHDRKKYTLSMLVLSLGCQLVFGAEELITDGGLPPQSQFWYFNVVFSFSLASLACYLLLDCKKHLLSGAFGAAAKKAGLLLLYLAAIVLFCCFAWCKRTHDGWRLSLDYGINGILLPLSVVVFEDGRTKRFCFFIALLVYCFLFAGSSLVVWYSLLSIPLLFCYNGKSGSRKFKYFFYVFYPAHLGVLYLISMLL